MIVEHSNTTCQGLISEILGSRTSEGRGYIYLYGVSAQVNIEDKHVFTQVHVSQRDERNCTVYG